MANPDTAVSATRGPNGQTIQTYKQWNPQNWFDTVRWSMNGTQLDSDFRAGFWWADSLDMKAGSAGLRAAADAWRQQHAKVVEAQAKVRSAQANLVGQSGLDIDAHNAALDKIHGSLTQHADAIEPISRAFNNSADIIDRGHARMAELWNKWKGDRANPPACHQDVVQMQPVIAGMAQAMLDSANGVQKGFQSELEMPQITVTPVSQRDRTDQGTAGAMNQTTGNLQVAGNLVPGSHLPGVATSGATTHPGHLAAAFTPGTVVSPTVSGATIGTGVSPTVSGAPTFISSGPQLAGMGATAFAPPPVSSAVPIAPITPVGSAGLGGGGFVPFVPGAFAGGSGGAAGISRAPAAPFAPFVGGGAGAGRDGRTPRPGERDKGDQQRRTGAMPLVGGSPLGVGGAGRARAQIRPGDAPRSQAGGIAASLLGRAAREDEGVVAAGSTKRRRQSRSYEEDRMVFLDEEAWLIDDPGEGVVTADGPDGPSGPVATPTVG